MNEEFTNPDGYVAAVAIAADVVAGDHCGVAVLERQVAGYRVGEDGEEAPVYDLGGRGVREGETTIPVGADDATTRALPAAEQLLEAAGADVVGARQYAAGARRGAARWGVAGGAAAGADGVDGAARRA